MCQLPAPNFYEAGPSLPLRLLIIYQLALHFAYLVSTCNSCFEEASESVLSEAMSGRVCRHWLRGRCRFGERCKFLHNTTDSTAHAEESSHRRQERDAAQESFHAWRRTRPQPGTSGKRAWITTALTLLNLKIDIVQQVIRHLLLKKGFTLFGLSFSQSDLSTECCNAGISIRPLCRFSASDLINKSSTPPFLSKRLVFFTEVFSVSTLGDCARCSHLSLMWPKTPILKIPMQATTTFWSV